MDWQIKDRAGEVWELSAYQPSSAERVRVLVLIVSSSQENSVHSCLVIDGGESWWRAGQLMSMGELVEGFSQKRIA